MMSILMLSGFILRWSSPTKPHAGILWITAELGISSLTSSKMRKDQAFNFKAIFGEK
jgi:hypothetical protein